MLTNHNHKCHLCRARINHTNSAHYASINQPRGVAGISFAFALLVLLSLIVIANA